MSEEESEPTPLRLRPRLRPDAEPKTSEPSANAPTPPPPASQVPEPPLGMAASQDAESPMERPRLRTKPRLNLEDDATEKTPAPAQSSQPPLFAPEEEPPISAKPPEPQPAATTKLRLQATAPASSSERPPPLPDSPPPLPPRPPATGARPSAAPLLFLPDDPPAGTSQPSAQADSPDPTVEKQTKTAATPKPPRRQNVPVKVIAALCLILVLIGGSFWIAGQSIYDHFFTDDPGDSISKLIVDKAQSAMEEQELREAMADKHKVVDPQPEASPPTTEAPAEVAEPEADENNATASQSATTPTASPAFLNLINRAVIGGVFQGEPARAFINGRTVRAGEMIDARLGVTFVGLDETRHKLIFRDASGAEVIRKF